MAVIQDVAKLAGVSVATVSRVMNDSTNVLPETVTKVRSAMETLNYQPNLASRNLRSRKSQMILVVIPDFSNPFWGDILDGMDQEAERNNYKLIIYASHSNAERERNALAMLNQRQADGAILLSPVLHQSELIALDQKHPIVQCCEYAEGSTLPHVSINNYIASYQAVEYLARIGHQKIAMISSTNGFVSTSQREEGFKKALEDQHLSYNAQYLQRGSYSFDSGYEKAQMLLRQAEHPTAILAISDTVAAGCLCAITEAGLRCPRDVAVIGFDNIPMSQMLYPKLSTVSQPRTQLGSSAVQMLIERLNGSKDCRQFFLPHELVIRQST